MLRILVFDGPEKSGKSTIIAALAERLIKLGHHVRIRRWGKVPHDSVYLQPLIEDVISDDVVIWDRSWASEYVYSKLLHRGRRLEDDPWLGEWLYSRAVQTVGVRFMVKGPHYEILRGRRDETDLPVDPQDEQRLYEQYARRFGWTLIEDTSQIGSPEFDDLIDKIIAKTSPHWLSNFGPHEIMLPPAYCGPIIARVIFVGEARGNGVGIPGAWLPFTSRYTMEYGRLLGDEAIKCGWSNVRDVSPQVLRNADCIIACGEVARKWVNYYVDNDHHLVLMNLPHPSYLYRYNNDNTKRRRVEVESAMGKLRASLAR